MSCSCSFIQLLLLILLNVSLLDHADRPTLIECIWFRAKGRRINIPQEIGVQYHQFGLSLLEDGAMARVNSIAHKHRNDVEQINSEIIQQWIAGRGKRPVTWETLTEVLHDSELTTLAGEIEAVKCLHNSEQEVTRVIPDGGFEPDKLCEDSVEQTVVANVPTGDVEGLKRRDNDIPAKNNASLGNGSASPRGTDPKLEQKFTASDVETVTEDSEVCKESAKKVNVTKYEGAGVLKRESSEQKAAAKMSSGSRGVGGTGKPL